MTQLILISLLALLCLGLAWAVDDGLFATVFAIEVAVAGCESLYRMATR